MNRLWNPTIRFLAAGLCRNQGKVRHQRLDHLRMIDHWLECLMVINQRRDIQREIRNKERKSHRLISHLRPPPPLLPLLAMTQCSLRSRTFRASLSKEKRRKEAVGELRAAHSTSTQGEREGGGKRSEVTLHAEPASQKGERRVGCAHICHSPFLHFESTRRCQLYVLYFGDGEAAGQLGGGEPTLPQRREEHRTYFFAEFVDSNLRRTLLRQWSRGRR